jgi:hypothetical protein
MTTKETYQTEQAVKIQLLISRIQSKSENFFNQNKDTWFGDLGYVADQLESIDKFLNDKYLTLNK